MHRCSSLSYSSKMMLWHTNVLHLLKRHYLYAGIYCSYYKMSISQCTHEPKSYGYFMKILSKIHVSWEFSTIW